jgi:hypothetical protein
MLQIKQASMSAESSVTGVQLSKTCFLSAFNLSTLDLPKIYYLSSRSVLDASYILTPELPIPHTSMGDRSYVLVQISVIFTDWWMPVARSLIIPLHLPFHLLWVWGNWFLPWATMEVILR